MSSKVLLKITVETFTCTHFFAYNSEQNKEICKPADLNEVIYSWGYIEFHFSKRNTPAKVQKQKN